MRNSVTKLSRWSAVALGFFIPVSVALDNILLLLATIGWLLGGAKLNGRAALVDVTVGRGHAILFGFRPQYRGQSMNTQPLLWGAILR